MFHLDADLKVYLHREAVDFRKSINGLATLVEQSMSRDPFARAVYAFRNRRCDRIKLLLYDRTGFLAAHEAPGARPLRLATLRTGGAGTDGRSAQSQSYSGYIAAPNRAPRWWFCSSTRPGGDNSIRRHSCKDLQAR